jgi:hypothetical protein
MNRSPDAAPNSGNFDEPKTVANAVGRVWQPRSQVGAKWLHLAQSAMRPNPDAIYFYLSVTVTACAERESGCDVSRKIESGGRLTVPWGQFSVNCGISGEMESRKAFKNPTVFYRHLPGPDFQFTLPLQLLATPMLIVTGNR